MPCVSSCHLHPSQSSFRPFSLDIMGFLEVNTIFRSPFSNNRDLSKRITETR